MHIAMPVTPTDNRISGRADPIQTFGVNSFSFPSAAFFSFPSLHFLILPFTVR